MSYVSLPKLEYGVEVTSDRALQDLIRLSYEGWRVCDPSDLKAYNVGQTISQEQHAIPGGDQSHTRRIFNDPDRRRLPSTSIQFTKRPMVDEQTGQPVYGFPLANGTIDFTNAFEPIVANGLRTANEDNPDDFRLLPFRVTASLGLNVTRMLNHQLLGAVVANRHDEAFELPPLTLLTQRSGIAQGDEFTLGEADNILIRQRQQAVAYSPQYRRMRSQYLYAWDDFITERLQAHYIEDAYERDEPRFSLSYIENYFEFRSENPLLQIEQLRPFIRSLGNRMRTMGRRIRTHEEYINGNEIGYVVRVATGMEIAIYAKTNKRIRIEARTTLSERERASEYGQTSHTRTSLSEIIDLMEHTATDATNIINQILRGLDAGLPNRPSEQASKTPYELLRQIMRAVSMEYRDLADNAANRGKIHADQDALITMIIHRNGVSQLRKQSLQRAIARLQRWQVLDAPQRRFRRLSDEYQQARTILYDRQEEYNEPQELDS